MTPTLQGDEEHHGLWQGINSATGERCKHYTNIQRVEALAMLHPLIDEVEQHKMGKGDGERLYLAAPGATMRCGVSVHKARDGLLSANLGPPNICRPGVVGNAAWAPGGSGSMSLGLGKTLSTQPLAGADASEAAPPHPHGP